MRAVVGQMGRVRLQGRLSIQALRARLPAAPTALFRFYTLSFGLSRARRRGVQQPSRNLIEGNGLSVVAPEIFTLIHTDNQAEGAI